MGFSAGRTCSLAATHNTAPSPRFLILSGSRGPRPSGAVRTLGSNHIMLSSCCSSCATLTLIQSSPLLVPGHVCLPRSTATHATFSRSACQLSHPGPRSSQFNPHPRLGLRSTLSPGLPGAFLPLSFVPRLCAMRRQVQWWRCGLLGTLPASPVCRRRTGSRPPLCPFSGTLVSASGGSRFADTRASVIYIHAYWSHVSRCRGILAPLTPALPRLGKRHFPPWAVSVGWHHAGAQPPWRTSLRRRTQPRPSRGAKKQKKHNMEIVRYYGIAWMYRCDYWMPLGMSGFIDRMQLNMLDAPTMEYYQHKQISYLHFNTS